MRLVRDLHQYIGLVLVGLVVLVSVTGLLLMHAKSLGLSQVTVKMPGYAGAAPLDGWKAVPLPDGSILVATKNGTFRGHANMWVRSGRSPARDLLVDGDRIYAATRDGLMISTDGARSWSIAVEREEFRALALSAEGIVAASTRGIYRQSDSLHGWRQIARFAADPLDVRSILPAREALLVTAKEGVYTWTPAGLQKLPIAGSPPDGRVELQKVIADLHTGKFFGRWFFVLVDANAVSLILLSLTGVWLWWYPRHRRQAVARAKRSGGRGAVVRGDRLDAARSETRR